MLKLLDVLKSLKLNHKQTISYLNERGQDITDTITDMQDKRHLILHDLVVTEIYVHVVNECEKVILTVKTS